LREEVAKTEFADYVRKLEQRTAAVDAETAALERQFEMQQALRRIAMAVDSARGQRELAEIDEKERTGEMTPSQAAEARVGVTERMEEARVNDARAAKEEEMAREATRTAQAQNRAEALASASAQAEADR